MDDSLAGRLRLIDSVAATRLWPLVIDRAATGLRIQIGAIPAGPTRHGKQAVFVIEARHDAHLGQALGNLFDVVVLGLKRVDQLHADQVCQLDFKRHGAAGRHTPVAHAIAVLAPGVGAVYVDGVNRWFHGQLSK